MLLYSYLLELLHSLVDVLAACEDLREGKHVLGGGSGDIVVSNKAGSVEFVHLLWVDGFGSRFRHWLCSWLNTFGLLTISLDLLSESLRQIHLDLLVLNSIQ